MPSRRQERISKMIHRELATIFLFEGKKLFGDAIINISRVIMSPDLSLAKVYLTFINVSDNNAMMEAINEHKSEIRKWLASHIRHQVRKIPELAFFYDDSLDYAQKMERLFNELKNKNKNKPAQPGDNE